MARPQPLIRTGLDALAALDDAPALDPAALICHMSRCGSTLVSRLLSTVPGTLVISEPGPINALLMAGESELDENALVPLLRATIRALGRRRFGDERHYVLKLSSWNVRRVALLRRAFPGVPIVWVQRAPSEIMASLLADPPGWAKLRHHPALARAILGTAGKVETCGDDAVFYLRALAAMLESVRAIADGPVLAIDYRDLPNAVWDIVAPFIGLDLAAADIAACARKPLRQQERGAAPFIAKPTAVASDPLRAQIAQILDRSAARSRAATPLAASSRSQMAADHSVFVPDQCRHDDVEDRQHDQAEAVRVRER